MMRGAAHFAAANGHVEELTHKEQWGLAVVSLAQEAPLLRPLL